MANVTRTQFDEDKQVTKKVFQEGVHLMDADLNEQVDVLVNHNRRALSALLGHTDKRFGDGFKVVGTGASLQVTIKAGVAGFLIDTELAALLRLKEDATLSGFTDWSGGSRTDYIYIDIEEKEFTPADDANIVNPAVGAETCRDMRLVYSFAISEGSAPGAPPSGHTYVTLATVTKDSGSNIAAGDVTVSIEEDRIVNTADIADGAITTAKLDSGFVGKGLTIEPDNTLQVSAITSDGGTELFRKLKTITGWDMTVTIEIATNFGGILAEKIVSIQATILSNDKRYRYPLNYYDTTSGSCGSYWVDDDSPVSPKIHLARPNTSIFNDAAYNNAQVDVIIEYIA